LLDRRVAPSAKNSNRLHSHPLSVREPCRIRHITDYGTNWAFVQHVLSTDTVFPTTNIKYRAVDAPAWQTAAYVLIIAVETMAQ
jgi:hypothetical protein